MGLPLYNPPNTLYLSELEPGPNMLPSRLGLGPTPSPKHARPHQRSQAVAQPLPDYHPSTLRSPRHQSCSPHTHKPTPSTSHGWKAGQKSKPDREGRDLTQSYLSGGSPLPSLEREEAFCGERMRKKRAWEADEIEDETTRELYRLGMLYDDPYLRGEGVTLDTILRDEPSYAISVGRKRGRRSGKREEDGRGLVLKLELSLRALEEDARLVELMSGSRGGEGDGMDVQKWLERTTAQTYTASGILTRLVPDSEAESQTQQTIPATQDLPELVSDSELEAGEEGFGWEVSDALLLSLEGADWEALDAGSESSRASESWVELS